MFQVNSRVERDNGIRFYEQDVLCSDYVFAGDMVIDLMVDYLYPGIGILLAANNGKPIHESDHIYLFKLGDNDFKVIEKHFLSQSMPVEASCAFASSDVNTNANLIFSKRGQVIEIHLVIHNAVTGEKELRELGHYTIKNALDEFRIGFYSNTGNTLKYASIASGIPTNWLVNIKNTNGGRVSFFRDGFIIEGCEYDAELEQQEIQLKAGTYYVGFERGLVNEKNDIECYVFESIDSNFDDTKKSILVDGKFTLSQDGKVNIKFKGTSGRITDVCIKDLEDSAYVETDLEAVTQDGSYITVNLTRLKSVRWKGIISDLPEYIDYTKEAPYGIVVTKHEKLTQLMANIELDKEYQYTYTVETKELIIQREGDLYRTLAIDIREDDAYKLIVFQNMSATISELIIVDDDGKETNVLLQKTFRKYVPSTISGPIIVMDEYNVPLDLSSSYREVVTPIWDIEIFSQDKTIDLKHRILNEGECIFVYGVPAGATIHMNRRGSIEDFTDRYTMLHPSHYSVDYEDGIVSINTNDRKLYKYIAVRYQQADQFSYLFTNYEREIFLDVSEPIVLEKSVADVSGGVRLYGIPVDAKIHSEYIYRVQHKTMVNAIDLYASKYDIVDETEYTVDRDRSAIEVAPETKALYKAFVVDYLKNNSFCINYLHDYGQYEVEVSTNKERVYMSYDMGADGAVSEYKITNIKPDKNKYIVLRKA
jgi:hypothetical protein